MKESRAKASRYSHTTVNGETGPTLSSLARMVAELKRDLFATKTDVAVQAKEIAALRSENANLALKMNTQHEETKAALEEKNAEVKMSTRALSGQDASTENIAPKKVDACDTDAVSEDGKFELDEDSLECDIEIDTPFDSLKARMEAKLADVEIFYSIVMQAHGDLRRDVDNGLSDIRQFKEKITQEIRGNGIDNRGGASNNGVDWDFWEQKITNNLKVSFNTRLGGPGMTSRESQELRRDVNEVLTKLNLGLDYQKQWVQFIASHGAQFNAYLVKNGFDMGKTASQSVRTALIGCQELVRS